MQPQQNDFGDVPIHTISFSADKKAAGDIMFVHMSWGGAWAFFNYLPFFAQQGYNAHALDLRGHGKSGGSVEGATMQDYIEDIRTAVEGLGLEKPIIVGHSMGGLLALMYASQFSVAGVVAMDASPSKEVQGEGEVLEYPAAYTPLDAGLAPNPTMIMKALSDIPMHMMMQMKDMLGVESGVARSERKKGVSVPNSAVKSPMLFIGAERGTSVPFGIGIEMVKKQAAYYDAPVVEIKGATHPGLLVGEYWQQSAQAILDWAVKLS